MMPFDDTAELERRILKGIVMEWRGAALFMEHEHRLRLAMPGFELSAMTHAMGKWVPDSRRILLSRRFVLDHPWLAVRDVLLHEMAHQLAEEALDGEPGLHGTAFKRACAMLGARPEATGTFATLSDATDPETLSENDRILLRVQKLLALAQGANRHEAESAMQKAQEYIVRYNVDLLALDARDRSYCSVCLGEPALRRTTDEYMLSSLLGTFYFVECVWIPAYVVARERMGKVLEISGSLENVKMASHVHAFMVRTVRDQWAAFNRHGTYTPHRKTDFAIGLLSGFTEKLKAQEKVWTGAGNSPYAVIRKGDTGLGQYIHQRYPRLRRCGGSGRRIHPDVHAAGQEAGRKTVLHKPIEAARGDRGRLLG